jgi:hypothetical protein
LTQQRGQNISGVVYNLDNQVCIKFSQFGPLLKVNPLKFRFMESLRHTANLKEFEFLRQFNKKQNMIKKIYQLNRNEKFVDKAQQCFPFLNIKAEFKFAVQ